MAALQNAGKQIAPILVCSTEMLQTDRSKFAKNILLGIVIGSEYALKDTGKDNDD